MANDAAPPAPEEGIEIRSHFVRSRNAVVIRAAITLVGEDHVSLGSDYDGSVDAPFDTAGLAALTQALMDQNLTEAQIAKVMGANMMRYLAETLPAN